MSLPKVIFEEFSAKMNEVIQSNPAKDIEKNIKSIVSSILSKMDLVTHDEFDIQQKMLQKMAIKMVELEQRITALETQHKEMTDKPSKVTNSRTTKTKTSSPTQTN